jgi:IMP dehydrogenase
MRFRSTAYTFDDVLLVPKFSDIASRADVDLSTTIGKMKLKLPIFSANMDTVTEFDMAQAMSIAGGAGVLHRFASQKQQEKWLHALDSCHIGPRIISIGTDFQESDLDFMVLQYNVDAICIDIAHGHSQKMIDTIKKVRDLFCRIDIIAGNVATGDAAMSLVDAGANIIKVGIGPGSVCSTRIVTGHGVPQLSAIMDVASYVPKHVSIIADGGIRYPGDIVKALAAGADAVMLGSLLAGTTETPGQETIDEAGKPSKIYRGMASYEVQKEKRKERTPRVEGVSVRVPSSGPVSLILNSLKDGIASGFSYSGARNLSDLREKSEFVVVTQNGVKESVPHHTGKKL